MVRRPTVPFRSPRGRGDSGRDEVGWAGTAGLPLKDLRGVEMLAILREIEPSVLDDDLERAREGGRGPGVLERESASDECW